MRLLLCFAVEKNDGSENQQNPQSGRERQRLGKHKHSEKRRHHRLDGCQNAGLAGLYGFQSQGLCQKRDYRGDQCGQQAKQDKSRQGWRGNQF